MSLSVSFVIPHKGRIDLLKQTVESILAQDIDSRDIDVVIVTQDPEPDAVIECFERFDRVKVVTRPESDSISALRNRGVIEGNSRQYLAFLDSDIVISPDWTSIMIEELKRDPRRVIVSSIQETPENATPIEEIRSLASKIRGDSNLDSLWGSNLLMEKATFENAGGFPESLRTCEDSYFTARAAAFGDLYMTTRTSHLHLGEDKSFRQLFTKEIWRGRSNFTSIKGRSIGWREYPSLMIPPCILLGSLAAIFLLLISRPIEAAVLLLMAMLPVVLYGLRLIMPRHRRNVSLLNVFRFYYVYFIARAIGSTLGLMSR